MTPTRVQVTFDCVDPHRLAAFWAAALGYEKVDLSAFAEQLVADGRVRREELAVIDGRPELPDRAVCRDATGRGPTLFFQRVPEEKVAKNRVHLDLKVGEERSEAEMHRLCELGARLLYEGGIGGHRCWTMTDIEGNEFCVE